MFYKLFLCVSLLLNLSHARDYKAVDELNIPMYMGKWYQVYENNFDKSFQGKGRCATAEYHLMENGNVSVFNKQIDADNTYDSITGVAYYKEGNSGGYLTVELNHMPPAPYWVLELGPILDDQYQYSIVSDNFGLSLFVLTRNVTLFYETYNSSVYETMIDFGFTTFLNSPIQMSQNDCNI